MGVHRKVVVESEGWSTPGPVPVKPIECSKLRIGLLVCADAYDPKYSEQLKAGGAKIILSGASWGNDEHAPNGEWEKDSELTGLNMIVCNRSGIDRCPDNPDFDLDCREAPSVAVEGGKRKFEFRGDVSTVLICEIDPTTMSIKSQSFETFPF
mmetsp:Transcript_8546/g.13479  ORF Transcript_8546/g.13479 Transcript_8546/m.13479 type:complete len:153 (+) Transcript_8546:548-1006(+)